MVKCVSGYALVILGLYEDQDADIIAEIDRIQKELPEDNPYLLSKALCELIRKGLKA